MNSEIPKKRGRKSKKDSTEEKEVHVPKKRGRKPKGGKIITKIIPPMNVINKLPNIIIHLKCSLSDLDKSNETLDAYKFNGKNELVYQELAPDDASSEKHFLIKNDGMIIQEQKEDVSNKIIWKKIKQLKHSLHNNDIYDKKSSCFWCTFPFDTPVVYIPKFLYKESYECYGCFCSPECGVGYLMNETIDMSTKFERYYLMNNTYCKVYDYAKNIKPAPSPYYLLEKFLGNLTIEEYRNLHKTDKLLMIANKPLSRTLPELYEDNDEFILNTKIIPSSSIKQRYGNILKSKSNA